MGGRRGGWCLTLSTTVQVSILADVLDQMSVKCARRQHRVTGPLAVAGVLLSHHVSGERTGRGGVLERQASVWHAPCASIGNGAAVIRTQAACQSYGRTNCDYYAYVPFMRGRHQDPCVLLVEHLLLVKCPNMGWPNDEARLAVGTLFDRLAKRQGAGLETRYNDDPDNGACVVPHVLHATRSRLEAGYKWAVHIRQIHCPVVFLPASESCFWITFNKMGYHGK